jgi:comEA protein
MWNTIVALAHRIGFTRNEAAVILFLGLAIVTGTLLSAFREAPPHGADFRAMYRAHDSAFAHRASQTVEPANTTTEAVRTGHSRKSTSGSSKTAGGMVNINTATASALETLPGVGKTTAEKIIAWRTEHGRFSRAEDIMKVPSIGEKKFEKMKHRITIE